MLSVMNKVILLLKKTTIIVECEALTGDSISIIFLLISIDGSVQDLPLNFTKHTTRYNIM